MRFLLGFRAVPTDATPQPPAIPDYELLRLIGRGSYGEVWLARGVTGIYRAVKLVWRDRFPEAGPYEREFHGLKEFAAVSLSEARQLALLHVGRDPGAAYFYYVMELADDVATGREIDPTQYTPHTLKEMRARRGRLPAGECIALGVELARALAGLHERGLVHRDIKPSNVVIVGGAPKLADIGLVTAASAALTFVGTEGFVPPEGPGAPSADVFALGKLLYELVTGLDRQDYPRLPAEIHEWPDRKEALELNEVLIRACEPHPAQRHADATALLDDLLLLQAGRSVRRLRKAERRLSRALRVAALLALIAGIAGLGVYVERRRGNVEMAGRLAAEAERDALARKTVYSATLAQAQRALEQDDFGRARKFLQSVQPKPGEPDLREFEWHALWREAEGDPATVLRPAGTPGQRVVFSPDGNVMAAQYADREVVLWDRASQRELRRIAEVQQLAGFSSDSRWLLGVDSLYAARRWALTDGRIEATRGPDRDWCLGRLTGDQWLTFVVAQGVRPLQVRALDFTSGRELWRGTLPHTAGPGEEETGSLYSSVVSPDGKFMALALIHGRAQDARWRIMVLALPSMTVRRDQIISHRPTALAFGRNSDELVCAWGDTGEVGLMDLRDGNWRWQVKLPITQIRALAHDDRWLAVGGRSSRLTLLDLDTGEITAIRRGQESDVVSVDFLPATHQMLSTGNGGDVRLWSLAQPGFPTTLDGFWNPAGGGRTLCLSPDGRLLAATSAPGMTRVVATDTGTTRAELTGVIAPIAFTSNDGLIWLIAGDGSLVQRSVDRPGENIRRIELPIRSFIATASPDGRWIAAADKEARLVLVDVPHAQVSPIVETGHKYPWWVTISSDGAHMATSGLDTMVRLWDSPGGRMIAEWKPANETVNAAFSPDGQRLALVQNTGMLEVRDTITQAITATLVTSSGILQAVVFDPAAPRLFLGGRDGTMHVVDPRDWKEIAQLRAASGAIPGTVARGVMSADGKVIAGYTESGVIRLWRKEPSP